MPVEEIIADARLLHGRRVRPVPLRHLRHGVPQGAARCRLRRVPRAAVPAAGRPAPGDRRGCGLELSPTFFITLLKALIAGDVLNLIGYRIRPYEIEPGATDRALEDCKRILADAFMRAQQRAGACGNRRRGSRGAGEPPAAQAEGLDHRRVLGDDDGGRRQLPAAALPRERRRGSRHPAGHRLAALQHLGAHVRHEAAHDAAVRRRRATSA